MSPVADEGLRGNLPLLEKQVDQGLHRLHLLVGHEPVVLGDGDEVDEAHVEHLVPVEVVEGVEPVAVVEVSVATEHLLHDALAILVERLREATRLADPVLAGVGIGLVVRVCLTGDFHGQIGPRRALHGVRGKHDRVMDLADNPLLHAVDEFWSRDLGRTPIHQPGVGQAGRLVSCDQGRSRVKDLYSPTCRHGWAGGFIADWLSGKTVHFLNDLQHAMEQAVLLDDCGAVTVSFPGLAI